MGDLPTQVSSFIRREAELQVRAMVAGSRLVTLAGEGGAGSCDPGREARRVPRGHDRSRLVEDPCDEFPSRAHAEFCEDHV